GLNPEAREVAHAINERWIGRSVGQCRSIAAWPLTLTSSGGSCRRDSFPRRWRFAGSFALEADGIPISAPGRSDSRRAVGVRAHNLYCANTRHSLHFFENQTV